MIHYLVAARATTLVLCRKDGSKFMGVVSDSVKLIFILVIPGMILFYIVYFFGELALLVIA